MALTVREDLNAKMIEMLASGEKLPWERGWDKSGARTMPMNGFSGHRYRGGNSLNLMIQGMYAGWRDMRFVTMKQATQMKFGTNARLNEKQIAKNDELVKTLKFTSARQHPEWTPTWWIREEENKSYQFVERWIEKETNVVGVGGATRKGSKLVPIAPARVYNVSQLDGVPPLPPRVLTWDPNEVGEQLLRDSGAIIEHGITMRSVFMGPDDETGAYYNRGTDRIHLPEIARFKSAGLYYATANHELSHWTGASTRLNRDMSGHFGSREYAREELRAEMSSMYLSADLGLEMYPSRTAAYVQDWSSMLKEEPNALFQAAGDAAKMADFIIGLSPDIKLRVDQEREKLVPSIEASLKTPDLAIAQ